MHMSENDVNNFKKEGIKSYKILAWRFISVLGHLHVLAQDLFPSTPKRKKNTDIKVKSRTEGSNL